MKEIILKDYQGNSIHTYIYEPQGKVKGVMQVIHGVSEHFARYGVFAEWMNQQGILVIGCDIIGHGLSAEQLEYIHFADKNGDILAYESVLLVKEYIEKNYSDQDVFLLGHSMGSFIARKMIIDFPDFYKKVILSGSAYKPLWLTGVSIGLVNFIEMFKGPKHVSKLIMSLSVDSIPKKMMKDKIFTGIKEGWLTRDEEIQKYYRNSNMCGQPISLEANKNIFTWMHFINAKRNIRLGNRKQPIYFMSGKNDALSNYGKEIQKLYDTFVKSGYENVKIKLWDDCRHEILNELNKVEIYQEILDFIQ